ncbi:selenocysteine-specific elongation factor [Onthophagus taurus]|uniref:selenocysteine-specific elongation factor n=1 Tax=Onthophagus taurus TaxID=166361 RepID=UPI0039BE19EF
MTLNLNIGLMGHVDAGKTSLAKALSHVASTGAFDKDPQAQTRGITLDLGFSACKFPIPEHLKQETDAKEIIFTLVDCPGHGSLLKTIIGGAGIIDLILLVVDVQKGIQAQTSECIVIGEIIGCGMIVVLNKIDCIEENKRGGVIEKMSKKIRKTLNTTIFKDVPIIPIGLPLKNDPLGIDDLINVLLKESFVPKRNPKGLCKFSVDHCFPIKGNGYVLTGTMLEGTLQVNDMVYIEPIDDNRKVKSIQVFKKPVEKISHGDRGAICVTNIENHQEINRALVCSPGLVQHIKVGVISLNRIKYFKYPIEVNGKYELMIGHSNALIKIIAIFTGCGDFNIKEEYKYIDNLTCNKDDKIDDNINHFVLFEFVKTKSIIENTCVIGFKPDLPPNVCRIAFWGTIIDYSLDLNDFKSTYFQKLKIYRYKYKEGIIERYSDPNVAIVKNMFKKETDLRMFIGFFVTSSDGRRGKIDGGFGKSGKVKVVFDGSGENDQNVDHEGKVVVKLVMKRFIFDAKKRLYQ